MKTVRFTLTFPGDLDDDHLTAFVRSLTHRPTGGWLSRPSPLVFGFTATKTGSSWWIDVPEHETRPLLDLLRTHLPSVSTTQADDGESSEIGGLAIELRLSQQDRPLRTDVSHEIAAGVLAIAVDLRSNERIDIEWVLGPALPRQVAKPVPRTGGQTMLDRTLGASPVDAEMARARNEKQREPVFGAIGRIAVAAATTGRRKFLARSTLTILRLTSQPSVHLVPRRLPNSLVLRRMNKRHVPLVDWPCVLNAAEFATLMVWPIGAPVAAGVTYSGHRQLPFPETLLGSSGGDRRVIGKATYPNRTGEVSLDVTSALQHLHVIGPTGVGKSTLLANLITQDIAAGRGVVVIDPKGDLIDDVTDRIPPNRINNVVVLDPADESRPVGLNVLGGPASSAEVTVDALVHLFRSLFSSSWGPRTQDVLHAGLLTLSRIPGMTLVELPALLGDAPLRQQLVAPIREDIALGPFWGWFESLSDAERAQVVAPVLNKVRAFTMRSGVRRMLGQSQPGFSALDVFTRRRIVLVTLKRGVIGPETANLLGGLVVSQLWQAAQSRASISPERRHPVMVYLDEFQDYLHLPTDLSEVLAQARGLGLGIVAAHQNLGQLSDRNLRSAVLQNARSRVVFQTGSDDAAALSKVLGGDLKPADLINLGPYETYARLMSSGASTSPGSMTTLPMTPGLGSQEMVRDSSRERYGANASEIDAAITARMQPKNPPKSGGRRRRSQ